MAESLHDFRYASAMAESLHDFRYALVPKAYTASATAHRAALTATARTACR